MVVAPGKWAVGTAVPWGDDRVIPAELQHTRSVPTPYEPYLVGDLHAIGDGDNSQLCCHILSIVSPPRNGT